MPKNSSISKRKSAENAGWSWSWTEELTKNPRKVAAPVSSFKFQKAPLAEFWNDKAFEGAIAEIEIDAGLNKYCKSKRDLPVKYWYIEILACQGYFFKVKFVGSSADLKESQDKNKLERWVCYPQLQEIGYYYRNGGRPTLPPFFDMERFNAKELEGRLSSLLGKKTVKKVDIKGTFAGNVLTEGTQVLASRYLNKGFENGVVKRSVGQRVEIKFNDKRKKATIWLHQESDHLKLDWGFRMNPASEKKPTTNNEPSTDRNRIEIRPGMLFELINPIRRNEIALAEVTEVLESGHFHCSIINGRLSQEDLDRDTDDGVNEFSFHIGSDQLFALGTFTNEDPPPRPWGSFGDDFDWSTYLENNALEALPLPQKENNSEGFEVGMMLEAVDPRYSDKVCPAVISKMVSPHAMFISFLGWGEEYGNWKAFNSLEIFPMGWSELFKYPLTPPGSTTDAVPASKKTGKK